MVRYSSMTVPLGCLWCLVDEVQGGPVAGPEPVVGAPWWWVCAAGGRRQAGVGEGGVIDELNGAGEDEAVHVLGEQEGKRRSPRRGRGLPGAPQQGPQGRDATQHNGCEVVLRAGDGQRRDLLGN